MKYIPKPARRVLAVLALVAVIAALAALLVLRPDSAVSHAASGGSNGPEAKQHGLPNFDIRTEHTDASEAALARLRGTTGRGADRVASIRDEISRGEEQIKSRLPDIALERSDRLGQIEVISPDVWKNDTAAIAHSGGDRVGALRGFLKENNALFGIEHAQADGLKIAADYTNPDGNLSFTHLEQDIDGVPVFGGEVKAGFDKQGRMIRVINNLAPGLEYAAVVKDFGNAADAVRSASGFMGLSDAKAVPAANAKASTDLKAVFGTGDWATTAEKMYFPTEPGVVVPAWRVLVWQPADTYYVIVDAQSGEMLWRKNITEDQSQAATYNVYRNPNAFIDVADSAAPYTPGPVAPDGSQASVIARQDLTLVGNEGDLAFNNNGWINDGSNITDGNANQAGIDRDGVNGVDAPQTGSPSRVFSSSWNPPPGNPAPGDDPLTAQAQRGAVIQMFYVMNRYHDALYKLGFNEAARNFQQDNFGRGGLGADRVSSEGQDSSGTNNANFSTPADGSRGRMQMFLWTGPTPDRDGTGDADIIIHEVTHGTSNRLHGNSSGLSTNMSQGMGEGWGDFYAHTMLAEPSDPINGIYSLGGYSTLLGSTGYTSNYYSGIRRFPKAVIAFVGPNGKPHNPLTFRYMNSDCNTLIGTTTTNPNSAYPRGPFGSSTCDQVHNLGEIWSSALWEVRALMIQRLGFTAGTQRVLQVVTDGMKLAPTGPTFLQERDAIITAANAYSTADADDVREGFRRRGMGYGASIQNAGGGLFGNTTAVTESFATWPGSPTPTPTVTPTPTPTPTATPTPSPTPTPVPTATVSGVITRDINGKGIGGVTVTLVNQTNGATLTTSTSGSGAYSIPNVATGFTYTATPSANRYVFSPASRSVTVGGDTSGVNFTGTRQ